MHLGGILLIVLGVAAVGLTILGIAQKPSSVYKNDPRQRNPLEGKRLVFIPNERDPENANGVRGHLEVVGTTNLSTSFYDRFWKRLFDVILSFLGIVLLSPLLVILSIAIFIDDPGPVMFTQKRIGRNKQYFKIHKFRSMKKGSPSEVPTHMLSNADLYCTKVGRFIRSTSLDELPQIWDIFIGNMSIIGPRPVLWNEDCLTAERDKYGAGEVRPGLTGWAQINGRDTLGFAEKAKLDGEYTEKLKAGGFGAFLFDCRCFIGTILPVVRREGIVEGVTDKMNKKAS